ncbi:hypothetical protein JG687_00012482 [Phytophthora cactorum]|uniref:Multifunctional fusion protein n=1 Tax=Phytophthora cactorum TaxID=29920 RepID=A0A8T1U2X8_9STRA|nr:hypothetical protein JG687_00012482 [Phytophthora cactorum]
MPLLVFFLLYVALAVTLSSSAPVGEQDRSTVAITRRLSEDPITSFQTLYPVDGVQQQEESVHQAPVLPVVVNESGPAVVIGVKTRVIANFAYRQAIRETWASQTDLPRDVKVFFVGCRPSLGDIYNTDERERIEKAIELEKQTYGDLLTHELDCDDSYIDLTAKVKEFIRFATQMFPNTSFVMVGNDDIYLRAGHLVNYLLKGSQSEHLYLGQVWDKRLGRSTSPVGDPTVPNYVSESFYPMSSFPPYARGLLYLIPADCARFITKNQRRLSSLGGMDDVSVAVWLLSIQVHAERLDHTPMDLITPTYAVSEEKRRFCAYLYARCDRPQREYMFDVLNAMEPVDALGVCAGSSRPRNLSHRASRFSLWYNDDAVATFRQYKFVIAFENSGVPGYVTEKLINPFLAGSIPIYLGNSTTVSQLYNPESFIDCGHFAKLVECAAYVMQVHKSPELYARMRRASPIRNITAFKEAFSWHPSVPSSDLADKVAKMLQMDP